MIIIICSIERKEPRTKTGCLKEGTFNSLFEECLWVWVLAPNRADGMDHLGTRKATSRGRYGPTNGNRPM